MVVGKLVYILSGTCGRAWNGFSIKAFQDLWGFVRLSLASAVMLWLVLLFIFSCTLYLFFIVFWVNFIVFAVIHQP